MAVQAVAQRQMEAMKESMALVAPLLVMVQALMEAALIVQVDQDAVVEAVVVLLALAGTLMVQPQVVVETAQL
jgi:hypothetical protein